MTQTEEVSSLYLPSDTDRETVAFINDRVQKMRAIREKSYQYFNDRSLVEFIDDSAKRFNGYIPPRDNLTQEWQARVFNNFTRNTVIGFLSKVCLRKPEARIVATNKEGFSDMKRAHILEKLNEYSQNHEDGQWKFMMGSLECVVKGTVIMYEGYKKTKRKIREIKKYDPSTGKETSKEKEITDYDDCYRQVVPLEDFYIANPWQPDIQEQQDLIWKSIVKKPEAEMEFHKYPNWKYVKAGAYTMDQQICFFKNQLIATLENDQVEIVRYFNRLDDRMVILGNMIVLYDGPIPFHHKKYPFGKSIYEPFSADFFWGNSLPNKISKDQDIINTLWMMMLDQGLLSIYKPIFTDDPDPVESTVVTPGVIIPVNNKDNYRVMSEYTGPDNSSFNLLQFAIKFAQDNSGGLQGGGSAETTQGGKVTARQVMLQEEQARAVLGLNSKMLEKLERDCLELRCKNILQFYTLPQKVEEISGTTADDYNKLFSKVLRVDDTELSDGTYGTTVIKMSPTEGELPTAHDLTVEEEMASIQGQNVEIFAITPEYIRNMNFDVQIVPESNYMQSKSLQQAMGIEFYQLMAANPIVNQEENTREVIELYDKDPDKFLKQMTPSPEMMMPGMPGQMPQMPQQSPVPAIASQVKGQPSLNDLLAQ